MTGVTARIIAPGGEVIDVPVPPRLVLQMVQQLQEDRDHIDRLLTALRPITIAELEATTPAPALALPPGGRKPKQPAKPAAWKNRRRCQKCEQLTATDPCEHCGAVVAPSGARK